MTGCGWQMAAKGTAMAERPDVTADEGVQLHEVAVALDCSCLNEAVLRTAAALAAAGRGRLRAIFVEDQCLQSLAELPVAREVSFGGFEARNVESDRLRHDISRAAEQARQAIADAAAQAQIEWAFDTVRGALEDAIGRAAQTASILALGSTSERPGPKHSFANLRATMRHGAGVIVAPPSAQPGKGPIVAVAARGAHARAIARTAARIAAKTDRSVHLLVTAEKASEQSSWFTELHSIVGDGAAIDITRGRDLHRVAWVARRTDAALVIADIDYRMFSDTMTAEQAAEAFGAPLLLLQV